MSALLRFRRARAGRARLALALALAAFIALAPGCRSQAGARGPALVVASDLDNAPFAYVDEAGQPAGRDVEMMAELARRLDRPLEWRRVPFAQLLPALEAGAADAVCATLGRTPERAERVLFTRAYFETAIAVVVRAGPGEPQRLDELAGRLVAAGAGTTSQDAVRRRLPHARLVASDKGASAAQRLELHAIDAVALDGPAADALARASQGKLARLAETLADEHYAIAVAPGRAELCRELDVALGTLAIDGWLVALDRRHGLTPGH